MSSWKAPPIPYPPDAKAFIPLENNPEVMTSLAHTLGLKKELVFHDVYSLTDTDLLSFMPRPALALLAIIPMTRSWHVSQAAEDETIEEYAGSGPSEPVIWFKQTIRNACGLIGLLHCVYNLPDLPEAKDAIVPGSLLENNKNEAIPLTIEPRAQLLYDSQELEEVHMAHARQGDTEAPDAYTWREPMHFVAFVKGKDGRLWELEGGRKGPVARGMLGDADDLLSENAFELGVGRILETARKAGEDEMRFSATVLAPAIV